MKEQSVAAADMNEKLTWEEIKNRYDQEWILLDDFDWPEEEIDPHAGVVRFHAKDRTEFDKFLGSLKSGFNSAIIFVGIPPKCADVAMTGSCSRVEYTG